MKKNRKQNGEPFTPAGPSADSRSCRPRLCSHNKQPAILTDQRFVKTAQVKPKSALICANPRLKTEQKQNKETEMKNRGQKTEGVRLIRLSFDKIAVIDAEDFDRLNMYKWCSVRMGQVWYAQTLSPDGRHLAMHRLITNAPKHLMVDHKDHNGLNNRKSNLRLCTQQQNIYNRRPKSGGSSRYKGVHWDKKSNKYRAKICHKSKQYHLGWFEDEDDAGRAYDRKARELFGEFAYLNFPDER